TTYILPTVLLNPPVCLHIFNTLLSYTLPTTTTLSTSSESRYPLIESLGPRPGSTPYVDVHTDDKLCWKYTALMVILQLLVFSLIGEMRLSKSEA
ncbi:hypothetical protein F5884DRAFT_639836, partial [Xylogone sp. PMI_703]